MEAVPQADPPQAEGEEAEGAPAAGERSAAAGAAGDGDAAAGAAGHGDAAAGAAGHGDAAGAAGDGDLSLDDVLRLWPAVLERLVETAPALAATFEGARPVAVEGESLTIGFPAEKTFNKRKAESPERREAVAAALRAVAGRPLRPGYVVLDGEAAAEQAPISEKADDFDKHELLERLKSEFDAEEVS